MLSRKSISLILCAMVLVSSCIVVTSNAQAAKLSDWSQPAALQLAGNYLNASDPTVDMNENGDAIAAWTVWDSSTGDDQTSVSAVTYTGGAWSSSATISNIEVRSAGPEVAMNDNGDALVVWSSYDGTGWYLQATSYADGTWGTVQNISVPVMEIKQIIIAFNDNGNGSLVWSSSESKESELIMAAIYSEGAWSSAQTISDTTSSNTNPAMALSHINGDVVAVWQQYEGGEAMLAAALYSDGVWGAPQNATSSGADYYAPAVMMDSHGSVLLACERSDGNKNNITMIQYAPSTGSWISVHTYTDDKDLYSPAIKVNDWDNVVLGWMVDPDTNNYMNATVFVDGAWTPITQLSTGVNDAYNLGLDINNDGDAVALWTESDGTTIFIRASVFSDGAWGVTQYVVEGYPDLPRVAMGGDGHAITVWAAQDPIASTTSTYFSIYTPPAPTVSITSPAEDSVNNTGSVTVRWIGTNADYYTVSVNGAEPISVGQSTFIALNDLDDGTYDVNVTAYNDAGRSSYVHVNFAVDANLPEVEITNPLVGAWYNTTTINVTWTASDPGSGIANMSVSMDGEAFVDVATNYKEFASLADGEHIVYVRAYDNAGKFATVGRFFLIDTELPILNITDPDEDALISSKNVQLVWTGSSESAIGRYWISVDGGEFQDMEQNTSYMLSGLAEGAHTVTLKARDYAGNYNETAVGFTVDSMAPVVSITAPLDDMHSPERNVTAEWTVSESGSGLDSVEISINGGDWISVAGTSYSMTNLTDGAYSFTVRATDVAGNAGFAIVDFFVDNTAPTATISPSGDGIAIGAVITVEFSEAMNQTSVEITVEGFTSVAGTVAWNGNIATFTPSSALPYNSGYTVNVTGKDLAGNSMNPYGYATFTTLKDEGTISGVVKDSNGNAVANATVTLSNGMTTTTGDDGRFAFTGVPSGSYTLNVTKDGFQTVTMTVAAAAGETIELETMSMVKSASGSDGGDSTLWIAGIIGVVVVAVLGIAFVMYRKKKA